MSRLTRTFATSLVSLALLGGCVSDEPEQAPSNFTSAEATLLNFEFDGELIASNVYDAERLIEDQMLYTIGHLNGDNSVGRLDKLEIEILERVELEDGNTHLKYRAKMPVGWGSKTNLPETYKLTLPLHVDHADYQSFTEKYSHSCVDWGAHDVDTGSMWYYFRPNRSGCALADEDVFVTTATVTVSDENTEGKYPEYHEVWSDDALTVVAIFGKYEDGATSGDAGISAYNKFVQQIQSTLGDGVTTDPPSVGSSPGVEEPDITFSKTLADGKKVSVVALLVDNVRTAGTTFNNRYEALSGDADMIFYNGHAGLGSNIRALASKGSFNEGKYQIFFMNGCDTFAYVDNQLAEAHAEVNPDDPNGTKTLDLVNNVMPSFFSSMPYASMSLVKGLLSYDEPKTYQAIFEDIDSSEVVVVIGEEDNVYTPGYGGGGTSNWEGVEQSGALSRGETTTIDLGELPAGSYLFSIAHDSAQPGGDVDLYLAQGRAPTVDDYDERPYLDGSDESISIHLDAPANVQLMLQGYDYADTESSAYVLSGKAIEE
jgi:hypothetical protein